MEIELHLTK